MKNKIKLGLTAVMVYAKIAVYAQIGGKLHGDPNDFIAMAKRPVLVELFEEKINDDGEKESEPFIPYYNALIKLVVGKYWKFNQDIQYKTTSEINKLKELKNDKYVVLTYIKQSGRALYGESKVNSNIIVPSLCFSRIEEIDRKPDYTICVPSSGIRKNNKYLECDFKFIVTEMQAHLAWIIQNNKTIQFNEYIKMIAKDNCPKLKDRKLLVDKNSLQPKQLLKSKLSEPKARLAYGNNIGFVTASELNLSYVENTKGTAILLSIPYGGLRPTPMEASQSMQNRVLLSYYKVAVDCETNELLWIEIPGQLIQGNTEAFIKASELKDMGECK